MINCEDADIILVAYGTIARVAKNVMNIARREGYKVGLIRPISLWPFPKEPFERQLIPQSLFDCRNEHGTNGRRCKTCSTIQKPVYFYGRPGGMIPEPAVMLEQIKKIAGGVK